MPATTHRRLALPLAGLLAAVTLTGCQAKAEAYRTVSHTELEQELDRLFSAQGKKAKSYSCPDPVKLAEGERVRCTIHTTTGDIGVTATLSNVKGSDFHISAQVDDLPSGGPTTT